jgi:predicted lysophospholipase L1 biosynthesis ABC-type transport system permease subunit
MNRHRSPWKLRLVMWSAIGASIALLGVLLAVGWDDAAWTTAAGVLLLACVAVCIFAVVQGRNADREVRRAVARLAAAREANERRVAPRQETNHGR